MSKVFIIDDDPIHQRIAQILISKNQIFDEYSSFMDAPSALDFLQVHAKNSEDLPEVILLDLNMPIMDGWTFLEEYQKVKDLLSKDIKIFIVSSSVDEKDRLRSEEFSTVKGFICKPLSPDILKDTIL